MRFGLSILLIATLSFIAGIFFPWWSVAPVSFFIACVFANRIWLGFAAGFLGIFLLWGILAIWIDMKNEHILSHKIAELFPLGGSSLLLVLITALLGALVAGFAGMAGASLRPFGRRF